MNTCAFNNFPDYFVQAFQIVVGSWTFSMLLLYSEWEDWPIFIISGSNEQLQQGMEYIILKPYCHSWWISKMQSGREDNLEERYAIKLCFKLGKNATETYGMLQTTFGASCRNWASVFARHKRFKERRESVRDDERCGRGKEVNTPEVLRVFRRDSVGKGQHSSNWVSGISTRTMHQSTTPSLSQTIWPWWASRQFHTVPIV